MLSRRDLLIASLLTTAGCSGGERRVVVGNREAVLHVGNALEPQSVDPHITTGVSESRIETALFESLVAKDATTLEPVPGVAERWEISADRRIYRFHLRSDARWSNGDPVTAEDFRWSWWRGLQPALANEYVSMYYPIKNAEEYAAGKRTDFSEVGIRVLDALTLEVELASPTPYFLQLIDHHSYYPLHRATLERFGAPTDRFTNWTRPGNMVTNGAFRLTEWNLYRHIRVEKNPFYWDARNVRLNAVVFYPTENQVTEERMFRSKQLHFTYEVPLEKVAEYRAEQSNELRVDPYLGTYYYMMNVARPGLSDPRVRRALAMAIDRKALIDIVLRGVHFPAYTVTPPGTAGYQPPKLFDFDPEGARQLLAAAGYANGNGLQAFELLYNTYEHHRKIAVAIQQMWRTHLNVQASLVNQEWKVYLDSRDRGSYDICRAGWIGDYVDPNTFLELWVTGNGNNDTGWSNAEYDELLLRRIPVMATQAERMAGFYKAETILLEHMPIIPIYTYSTNHLVANSVKQMPRNILDHYVYKDVYLEQSE